MAITGVEPIKLIGWTPVLPTEYDDSLTYYEAVTKCAYKINEIIEHGGGSADTYVTKTAYDTKMASLDSSIETLDDDVEEAQADITTLETTTTSLGTRVTALENASSGKAREITSSSKVLCIGDSFLQGYTGSSGTQTNWGDFIALKTGCTVYKQSDGGAGFYQKGNNNNDFNDLVNAGYAVISNPDFVIIGGGYNDCMASVSYATLKSAADTLVANLRTKFPNAFIYIFPNLWGDGKKNPSSQLRSYGVTDEENVAKAVQDAVKEVQTSTNAIECVMGAWTWLYGKANVSDADTHRHPLTKGQAIIANSMLEAIAGNDPTVRFDYVEGAGYKITRDYLQINAIIHNLGGAVGATLVTMPEQYVCAYSVFRVDNYADITKGELLQFSDNAIVVNAITTDTTSGCYGTGTTIMKR